MWVWEAFYLEDPCELTFANTLLLSNAAISLGNAFINLEISSEYIIFFTLWSFFLSSLFISLQIKEFRILALSINDSLYSSLFFFLTGLHFFHLSIGLILLIYFWCRSPWRVVPPVPSFLCHSVSRRVTTRGVTTRRKAEGTGRQRNRPMETVMASLSVAYCLGTAVFISVTLLVRSLPSFCRPLSRLIPFTSPRRDDRREWNEGSMSEWPTVGRTGGRDQGEDNHFQLPSITPHERDYKARSVEWGTNGNGMRRHFLGSPFTFLGSYLHLRRGSWEEPEWHETRWRNIRPEIWKQRAKIQEETSRCL